MAQYTKTTDKQLIFYDSVDHRVYRLAPDGQLLHQALTDLDTFDLDMLAWESVPEPFAQNDACFYQAVLAVLNDEEGAQHPSDIDYYSNETPDMDDSLSEQLSPTHPLTKE